MTANDDADMMRRMIYEERAACEALLAVFAANDARDARVQLALRLLAVVEHERTLAWNNYGGQFSLTFERMTSKGVADDFETETLPLPDAIAAAEAALGIESKEEGHLGA